MNLACARQLVEQFDFNTLFADELLWNRSRNTVLIEVEGTELALQSVAEKRSVQVLLCPPGDDGSLPHYARRQIIERQVAKQVREHLIIYVNAARTVQVWQWVARELGRPAAYREIVWQKGQSADLLLEKLGLIAFRLEEDDELLTVLGVAGRLRDAFDRDKLTKRFYDDFKLERDAFLKFIKGMPADASAWYTSVMINRVMFVYFLQRKRLANNEGFLDNRHDYLRHHLQETQRRLGKNRYYRDFLCPLFFQGFAQSQRREEGKERFGDIPFLNGGLFNRHPLEEQYGAAIQIADAAFEKLFDYFDAWDWHLDDRPLQRSEASLRSAHLKGEINPEVLGYIFEKYINQKQLGAYYTKEDITGYICRNTIVPGLLDKLRARCQAIFDAGAWPLLQQDPDRYIWPAMRHGTDQPLPDEIAAGLDPDQPDLIEKRKAWNRRAPETHALPTEIWREVVARHERYHEVRRKLASGEVREVNDLITYNLNVEQFAQDIVARSESPEIVRAMWRTLVGVVPAVGSSHREFEYGFSVLDPTCGSGAFLFAALNVLEPLYRACLTRMRAFVLQADLDGERQKYPDSRKILADVEHRPNESYFIYKAIIVNNLYGVDIVEEAVEIAKLRLFLKLVAQLEDRRHIEPLPDIDFNIRAGNALVGFATYDEVKKAVTQETTGQSKMLFDDAMTLIEQDAHAAERAYLRFRQQQVALGGEITVEDKQALRDQLTALEERLNWYLARDYGIDPTRTNKVEQWKASHKPFHWFVDFYGIVNGGGFGAVVGNPPYIARNKVLRHYVVRHYHTLDCPDIYAWCLERAAMLGGNTGACGMIVPLSLTFSDEFAALRRELSARYKANWYASFARIPAALFAADVRVRNTIHIGRRLGSGGYTTRLHRWFEAYRPYLMSTLTYATFDRQAWFGNRIPKLDRPALIAAFEDLTRQGRRVSAAFSFEPTGYPLYFKKSAYNWLAFSKRPPPAFDGQGARTPQTKVGVVYFRAERDREKAMALLNGKIQFAYWVAIGDDFDVTTWMFGSLPIDLERLEGPHWETASKLVPTLWRTMQESLTYKLNAGKRVGSFNLTKCRAITDDIDREILAALKRQIWEEIELLHAQTVRTAHESGTYDDE